MAEHLVRSVGGGLAGMQAALGLARHGLEVVIVETLGAFDVEGAAYMVEVKNVTTEREIGSEKFERYAIDSVEESLSREAGEIMRDGQLFVRGGRFKVVNSRFFNNECDDNGPDVRADYVDTLVALGRDFDVWDTANTDDEI